MILSLMEAKEGPGKMSVLQSPIYLVILVLTKVGGFLFGSFFGLIFGLHLVCFVHTIL